MTEATRTEFRQFASRVSGDDQGIAPNADLALVTINRAYAQRLLGYVGLVREDARISHIALIDGSVRFVGYFGTEISVGGIADEIEPLLDDGGFADVTALCLTGQPEEPTALWQVRITTEGVYWTARLKNSEVELVSETLPWSVLEEIADPD